MGLMSFVKSAGAAIFGSKEEEKKIEAEVQAQSDAQREKLEQLRALKENDMPAMDGLLLPIETALTQWPDVQLSADAAFYLQQGQAVLVPRAPTSGWVRLYAGNRDFLGMGEILDDGRVAPRRLMKGA